MPGFDRTGPEGAGSQTGRGFGKCNPDLKENAEGNIISENEFGRRWRMRFGGRGRRFGKGNNFGMGRGFGPGRGRNSGPQGQQ